MRYAPHTVQRYARTARQTTTRLTAPHCGCAALRTKPAATEALLFGGLCGLLPWLIGLLRPVGGLLPVGLTLSLQLLCCLPKLPGPRLLFDFEGALMGCSLVGTSPYVISFSTSLTGAPNAASRPLRVMWRHDSSREVATTAA